MGPNSLIIKGLGTLGIRVIVVAFTSFRSRLELKKEQITQIVSIPTILQAFLKNHILNPSGLGALRKKRTFWISSSIIGISRFVI
jgi:hypothetical protein